MGTVFNDKLFVMDRHPLEHEQHSPRQRSVRHMFSFEDTTTCLNVINSSDILTIEK